MLSQVSTADLLAELRHRREECLAATPSAALALRLATVAAGQYGVGAESLFSRRRFSARASDARHAVWQAMSAAGVHRVEIAGIFNRSEAAIRHGLLRTVPTELHLTHSA